MNWRLIIGGSSPTSPSLSLITSNNVYSGSDRMLVYTPPGYNLGDDYPVLFFYHGNGERGVPSDNNYLAGTGNSSQTVFSGNLNNTQRIIHSELYVQVNSVTVATGRRGVITGTGVTGTYSFDTGTSAAFSITFTNAPTTGHEVRVYYTQSNLLGQGVFRYLNLGDEPNLIIVAPQMSAGSGGFSTAAHWTAAITYLIDNDYKIDTNRLYSTGLSLGGVFGMLLLSEVDTLTYKCAAFADIAPGETLYVPASGAAAWTSTSNIGKLIVRGTSDTNGTNQLPSSMANCNAADREFPMQGLLYWNIGHTTALWDTKVYNRKNRTDAAGAADFDYIEDFLLLYSLNAPQQAELWVERAELTDDSGDYRVAARQVSLLSAGAKKTELEGRLAAVKSGIGTIIMIDVGTSFRSTSGNYNNLTNAAASTSISNLVNIDGGNTGYTFTTTAIPDATGATIDDIGTQRVQGRQYGFELNTTRDGHRIDAAGTTGTYTFSSLNNSKTYSLKVYAAASNSAWSARAEIEVVCASVTRYRYVDTNNFQPSTLTNDVAGNYVQFNNLTPSSGNISFTIRTRQTASTERLSYLQVVELIENP
jgi:hypothetical protein